ncbi:MAG: glucose-6-phosphate isomerase [Christensenellaceae bacterium]|jgi:glucose-6-phosphate isomerase|nr:glucose-6-phosphate isomerase [Christensenellaceae bacterium]
MQNFKTIRFDYNNMMLDYIGEEGISSNEYDKLVSSASAAHEKFMQSCGSGMTGWMSLPYNQEDVVSDILKTAKEIRQDFDAFVVLGIGGSALGPMAVFQALCHLRHNDLQKSKRKAPKFYVEDNIDPERMNSLFDVIDLKKTVFNVITKSGSTSETMSQFLIIIDVLKKAFGSDASSHIIATTDEKNGNLIKIAKDEGFKTFIIPDGVGGRFSELCPVGLFPAAVLGIDIKLLLKGANDMRLACSKGELRTNPALAAAALQYYAMSRGKSISVMMPYADSLKLMADWYCQLWGESLGKATDNLAQTVNVGQTPVKALGVTDQHSQVQLYTEGPFDKVVTFIGVDKYRCEVEIPLVYDQYPSVSFLSGHTLNELITAEMIATEFALTKNKRMNNTIMLPDVTPHTIGQLLMFFMLETAYAGVFLNINTFDQPGVEEGKNATYALLGRNGYAEKANEIKSRPSKNQSFIVGL